MKKEEFIARFHPSTKNVFKKEAQNQDLKERLESAKKDPRLTLREREGIERLERSAEAQGMFKERVVVDKKEGEKVAKKLEFAFRNAFETGALERPSLKELRDAQGK